MNELMINAKKIQICLKNGFTLEETAQKYQTTEELLKTRIEQLYSAPTTAKKIFDSFEQNSKQKRRRPSHESTIKLFEKSSTRSILTPQGPRMVQTPVVQIKSEPTVQAKVAPVVQAKSSPVAQVKSEPTLSDLREEEARLSAIIMEIEGEHNELSNQHRTCIVGLRKLQDDMANIKESLIDCKRKFDKLVTEADSIAVQMNENSAHRRETVEELEKVRQKVEELTSVTICVASDGTIEAPDNPDFVINDEGFQAIRSEIAEKDECLDLRVRDVITLARLLKICENIKRVTLICDHEELEKAFWAFRKNQ